MKIASYNINGINGRPPLARVARGEQPDVSVCKSQGGTPVFPAASCATWLRAGGRPEGQPWGRDPRARERPGAHSQRVPGDPSDEMCLRRGRCRRVLIGCIYAPNATHTPDRASTTSWPGRALERARGRFVGAEAARGAGATTTVPTDADIYNPESPEDRCAPVPEPRAAPALASQGWPMRSARDTRTTRLYVLGLQAQRVGPQCRLAYRLHLLSEPQDAWSTRRSIRPIAAAGRERPRTDVGAAALTARARVLRGCHDPSSRLHRSAWPRKPLGG